jgi:multiple sugar transport system ATP-binding protein
MSVEQNLKFGLENQKLPKTEIAARVAKAANILQIEHLLARRPSQLSGGQSQRVAIGRAIVKEPKAFLFDEPLSNLDAELRVKMRGELISLHKRLGSTMIYVTHDQVEAMTMADQIVVLNSGRVEQVGAPIELYAQPANLFVARFLGAPPMNLLKGKVARIDNRPAVTLDEGTTIALPRRDVALADGAPVTLGIRPEHCEIGSGPLTVDVGGTEVLGAETIIHAETASATPFTISQRGISRAKAGDRVPIAFRDAFVHLFDDAGQAIAANGDWRGAYLN